MGAAGKHDWTQPLTAAGAAPERGMPSEIAKHSLVLAGHRTSVSLEGAFWHELARIAASRGVSVNRLVADIDRVRAGNLSSAIRVFVLTALKEGG